MVPWSTSRPWLATTTGRPRQTRSRLAQGMTSGKHLPKLLGLAILSIFLQQIYHGARLSSTDKAMNRLIALPGQRGTSRQQVLPANRAKDWHTANRNPVFDATSNGDSFSACLLVMDDNHFLIEWLAYHYYALPLRYLIIAVDPRSKTSPRHILDRWRSRMTIIEWNDQDFLLDPKWQRPVSEEDSKAKFILHRERQRHFYPACLEALKEAGRTWTAVIDIDEYLILNHNYVGFTNATWGLNRPRLLGTNEDATILEVLEKMKRAYGTDTQCIMMPRLRFGNFENSTETSCEPTTDHSSFSSLTTISTSDFSTLRWHWRAGLHDRNLNRNPKSMVHVQRISNFSRQETDAHRPVRSACPKRGMYTLNRNSPLVVHHYVGTWEQYNFRRDAREGMKQRNPQRFAEYGNIQQEKDMFVCPWLSGFVRQVGVDDARRLLAGVGNVAAAASIS